ncbi:hypothetical protein TorRG33x02_009450, partial [Trema orientale]
YLHARTQHVSAPTSSEPVTSLASVKLVICLALLSCNRYPAISFPCSFTLSAVSQLTVKNKLQKPSHSEFHMLQKLNPAIAKRGPPNANPARDA